MAGSKETPENIEWGKKANELWLEAKNDLRMWGNQVRSATKEIIWNYIYSYKHRSCLISLAGQMIGFRSYLSWDIQ